MLVDMMIIHKVTLDSNETKNVVCSYFDLLELMITLWMNLFCYGHSELAPTITPYWMDDVWRGNNLCYGDVP